ncbi:LexA family transcriptional regulator [Sphingobacterium hotanense]|uniref:Helix-turn-helix domain-containing protein n=1 Tax=Sphingobacterium hotanense TaxID=649196 RepID=A0ABT7NLA0_9SPHI|nr:S24 family peptidase [Sphingobacterium hotanense]MDM1048026.1 helix-turn-helix domain-containing protein [Sphingobacterium hotanense]
MSLNTNKSLILNKIKSHYNFKSDAEFARFLEIKPSTLANWYARNSIDYDRLFSKCEGINANWLLSGEGPMLISEIKEQNTFKDVEGITRSEFLLRTDKVMQYNQIIPLYDIHATAGLVTLFKNDKQTPVDYYSIPNLPKVDGAVQITGDSMYPILKSGDIVFYREINNILENIYYGEMYLLDIQNDDDEYTTVKYIQTSERGPEWIKIVSYNSHHSPKDIHLSSVKAAAFIKGSLRLNSMR